MSKNEEFNWESFDSKGFGSGYSEAERKQLESLYSGTMTEVAEKEVVKGTIVGITDRDVILNIGFKSDGLIPLSEFRDMENLKVGLEVE
ncbi:MAG TPA: S1 RNA-binding domain-containing protein, partial [Cytophagaceae bacterium]